jgi:hypothetical protein
VQEVGAQRPGWVPETVQQEEAEGEAKRATCTLAGGPAESWRGPGLAGEEWQHNGRRWPCGEAATY